MKESPVHLYPTGRLAALVGNPNCGKTALFNRLTGSSQKVANYAGVTVERKEGRVLDSSRAPIRVLDLPGTYSLYPRSPDESVTVNVLRGTAVGEKKPDLVICVVDATNLRRSLRLVLSVKRLGIPYLIALNMTDLANKRGASVNAELLSHALSVPVVNIVATSGQGLAELQTFLRSQETWQLTGWVEPDAMQMEHNQPDTRTAISDNEAIRKILQTLGLEKATVNAVSEKIDRVLLDPFYGPAVLIALLFIIFQAVFTLAEVPMGWIEAATATIGNQAKELLPDGWPRSLLVEGIIAGLGGVIVFLPQIVILFFFILALEDSGYLPRAAFLLDRLMGSVGLSGRSFIPLLSSFACAIPGIMAARTIADNRDRLVTIAIAPLMTCSARLPIYALLIGAFIPAKKVLGGIQVQGLVLFALYLLGIAGAFAVAWILKKFNLKGQTRSLMMELPEYRWPSARNIAIGLWQRVIIFLRRVGGIILILTILLWFLASFPAAPVGATGTAIEYSLAGTLGRMLAVVFEPIGFNWQISIALVPGLAAREVAVSSLATVYALSAGAESNVQALAPIIAKSWSFATALSLLAWYVFAPQCLSTLAVIKRETGGWKMPIITAAYLFLLAYGAAFVTYRLALWLLPFGL